MGYTTDQMTLMHRLITGKMQVTFKEEHFVESTQSLLQHVYILCATPIHQVGFIGENVPPIAALHPSSTMSLR